MGLEIEISSDTAAWLELQAKRAGLAPSDFAAAVLEQAAAEVYGPSMPAATKEERLRKFREWADQIPERPGPAVDTSRESIYD